MWAVGMMDVQAVRPRPSGHSLALVRLDGSGFRFVFTAASVICVLGLRLVTAFWYFGEVFVRPYPEPLARWGRRARMAGLDVADRVRDARGDHRPIPLG